MRRDVRRDVRRRVGGGASFHAESGEPFQTERRHSLRCIESILRNESRIRDPRSTISYAHRLHSHPDDGSCAYARYSQRRTLQCISPASLADWRLRPAAIWLCAGKLPVESVALSSTPVGAVTSISHILPFGSASAERELHAMNVTSGDALHQKRCGLSLCLWWQVAATQAIDMAHHCSGQR